LNSNAIELLKRVLRQRERLIVKEEIKMR